MASERKKVPSSTWQKVRKLLNDLHLWMGLTSGLIVFVVCLSGTIYVYNTELREMAAPELYRVEPLAERLPAEELITKVKTTTSGKVLSLKVPHDPTRSYQIVVRPAEEKKGDEPGSEPKPGEGKREEGNTKAEKRGEASERKATENSARTKPQEGAPRRWYCREIQVLK